MAKEAMVVSLAYCLRKPLVMVSRTLRDLNVAPIDKQDHCHNLRDFLDTAWEHNVRRVNASIELGPLASHSDKIEVEAWLRYEGALHWRIARQPIEELGDIQGIQAAQEYLLNRLRYTEREIARYNIEVAYKAPLLQRSA